MSAPRARAMASSCRCTASVIRSRSSSIMSLPDPRRYGPGDPTHPLLKLADGRHQRELSTALRELAGAGRDLDIANALAATASQEDYARLWSALCLAIEKPS